VDKQWVVYDTADGLPWIGVSDVVEDSEGRIWIATNGESDPGGFGHGGIAIYDGTSWSRLDSSTGLPSNHIRDLAIDSDGRVWVATDKGIAVFTQGIFHTLRTHDPLTTNIINDIAVDKNGYVWLATGQGFIVGGQMAGGGLIRVKGDSWTRWDRQSGFPSNSLTSLAVGRDGALWIGTADAGLLAMRKDTLIRYSTADGFPLHAVTALVVDSEGHLWVGTWGDTLAVWNGSSWTQIRLPEPLRGASVWALAADSSGGIWVGNFKGIARFYQGQWAVMDSVAGLAGSPVEEIAVGVEGRVYVVTTSGLWVFDGTEWEYVASVGGVPSSDIRAIAPRKGGNGVPQIAVGTWGSGVVLGDSQGWTPLSLNGHLAGAEVSCLAWDREGRLWVGTWHGISAVKGIEDPEPTSVPPPQGRIPSEFTILSFYPNPWMPTVSALTIRIWIASPEPIDVQLYNLVGQLIRRFDRVPKSGGIQEIHWDGLDERGRPLPAGVYWIRARVGDRIRAGKVVMLR